MKLLNFLISFITTWVLVPNRAFADLIVPGENPEPQIFSISRVIFRTTPSERLSYAITGAIIVFVIIISIIILKEIRKKK